MGDWRQPREGLTANERGLPLKWTDELIGKLGLKVARRRFCMFSPLRVILLKGYGQAPLSFGSIGSSVH